MITFQLNLQHNPISKLPVILQDTIFKAFEEAMNIPVRISQEKYLSGPRPEKLGIKTGHLRSKVNSKVIRGIGGIFAIGILGVQNLVYSWIHELGGKIRPHPIEARKSPMLVFFWKKENRWMKIRKVRHPGVPNFPKRPFLRPALEESLPQIEGLLNGAIMRAYKQAG